MEAVPRMPMLSFELKHSPEYIEFGPTLKRYIQEHYGEDPAHYNKSCNELEQLRQSAVHVSHDFMGCSTLKKYYSQLQFLQGRFPMLEGGEASIPFTWEEVYSGREMTLSDIKFEQACVLYNIGALHSVLGAMDTRQSADGMKVSCTHFQCASWAFEYLRDHFGSSAMSLDMSHELLTFKLYLMLAQAQECILEKSMTDSRKSTITSKVSAQIVEFYMTSLKHLDVCNSHEFISSKRYKDWKKRIDIKILFYTCITNFYMGCQSEEQQKHGQCLAYFTHALEKLTECEKLAKNETVEIQDSLRFTHDVVGGKQQSAKKDNDFVYHDKIPAYDTLPEIKGASLVKGIPFNPSDPEISGPDIFNKLVPMSAHEASSLYSEEKATLLRRIASEIQEKNDELNQYLASLQLDQTSINPEPERLPQQLLEKCAALSVRPTAIKDLVDSMTAVSNVATDVDLGIKEIQQTLQDESTAELEYQATFGKRNPNAILSEIAQECARLEEGHKIGSQSNNDLHKAMNTHINNLKLLSSPLDDLQKLLPSVDQGRDPESGDVIKQLNGLLSKIDEMRTQRQTLEDSLRKEILEDDITGVLVQQEGANRDVLFKEQLKKHDKTSSFIRQNLTAQGNILRALTDANAKYASVRRATSEALAKREQIIRDLINSYEVYEDLKAKSLRGLDFYKKLETNVGRLLTRCKNVCKVQHDERQKMYNKYRPKVAVQPKTVRGTTDIPDADMAGKPSAIPVSGRGMTTDNISDIPDITGSTRTPGSTTMAAMFDGPKLKDYLPFMKPKTFGKKDGSPPITAAHPNVQDFINQSGSLPNSGTASPVHLPHMSDSVPASPDHIRHRFDGRLGPGTSSSHAVPQPSGPDLTQGHLYQPVISSTQSQLPQGYIPTGQVGPDLGQLNRPESPYQLQMGQGPATGQEYVPLDQAWKKDKQSSQASRYMSPGPKPMVSRSLKPRQDLPPSQSNVPATLQSQQNFYDQYIAMSYQSTGYGQQDPTMSGMPMSTPASQHQQYLNQFPPVSSQGQVSNQQPMGSHMTSFPQQVIPPQSVPLSGQRGITNTVATAGGPVLSPGSQNEQGQGRFIHQGHGTESQGQTPGQMTQQPYQQGYIPQSSQQQTFYNQPQSSAAGLQLGPGAFQGQGQAPASQQQSHLPVSQTLPGQPQHSLQQQQQPLPPVPQHPQIQPSLPSSYQSGQLGNQGQQQVDQSVTSGQFDQSRGQVNQVYRGNVGPSSQLDARQQVQSFTPPSSEGQHQGLSTQGQGHGMVQPVSQGQNQFHQNQAGLQQQPQNNLQQAQMYHNVVPQSQQQGQRMTTPVSGGFVQPNHMAGQHIGSTPVPMSSQSQWTPSQTGVGQRSVSPMAQQIQPPQLQNFQQNRFIAPSSSVSTNVPIQNTPRFASPVSQGQQNVGQQTGQGQNVPSSWQQQQNQIQQPSLQQYQPNSVAQTVQPMQQPNKAPAPGPQGHTAQQQWQQPQKFSTSQAGPQSAAPNSALSHGQVQIGSGYSTPTGVSQQSTTVPSGGQLQQHPQQAGVTAPSSGYGNMGQQISQKPAVPSYSETTVNRQFTQGVLPQGQYVTGSQGQQILPQGQSQSSGNQVVQNISHGQTQYPSSQGQTNASQGQPQFGRDQGQQNLPQGHSQYPNQGQQHFQGQTQYPTSQGQQNLPQGQTQYPSNQGQQNLPQGQSQFTAIQSPQNVVQTQYPRNQGQQSMPQGHAQLPGNQGQTAPVGQTAYNQRPGIPNQAIGPQFRQVSSQQNIPSSANTSHFMNQNPLNINQSVLVPQVVKPATPVNPSQSQTMRQETHSGIGQGHLQPSHSHSQSDATRYQALSPTHGSFPGQHTDPDIKPSSKPVDMTSSVQPVPIPQSVPIPHPSERVEPVNRQLSTASSLDEILSSSPDAKRESFLAPKVLTAQEIQQQKEDQLKNSSQQIQSKDPYKDKTKLDKFVAEVEKLAKFVEGFEKPLCSGPTPLDVIWKELMEEQDKAGRSQRLAIARCYPMKNRDQDIMPYDDSRVLLTTLKDDYINASWINDLSPACPKFIGTQAPLPVTLIDYWLMIYEQGVEVLVTLSSDIESGKKFPAYLPKVKGEIMEQGTVQLTLQSIKQKSFWTERILHLRHAETKTGRTLVHLEYSAWPISGFPDKVSHLLQFITEVHSFYRQQRSLLKPIVVNCGNGVGRTGMFVLIYVGMQEINHGDGIINIQEIAGKMLWRRRNVILKQDQLKFCYEAILYYAQDVLAKEGILVHKKSFSDQLPKPGAKSVGWEPGQDILFGSMSFTNLQSNIAKLGTKTGTQSTDIDEKLEMLKKGEKLETSDGSNLIGGNVTGNENCGMLTPSGSLLPDVVQNPGITIERKSPDSVINEVSTDGTDLSKDITDNVGQMSLTHKDSTSSLKSLDSISSLGGKPSSVSSSPAHQSREVSTSPNPDAISSSLAELQDPSKFTLGTSEGSKRKITKADFTGEKKTVVEQDPNDPLSSLDPFWTVK
ncbi:Tyrosine-protein phosphatase non-receptor type 23 [Mactra antiquata]